MARSAQRSSSNCRRRCRERPGRPGWPDSKVMSVAGGLTSAEGEARDGDGSPVLRSSASTSSERHCLAGCDVRACRAAMTRSARSGAVRAPKANRPRVLQWPRGPGPERIMRWRCHSTVQLL